ncbi:MAG: phosphatase PAP2 family protein [Clostridia bacterium]|nr:phosphatase PAP2 family protein [Clostridia bacterium]
MTAFSQFEGQFLIWIQENLRGFLDAPMRFITMLGDHGYFWIALTLLLLIFKKTRKAAACSALAMIFTLLVVNICIKPLAGRVRPYEVIEGLTILVAKESEFSFPSGHSANSLSCAWPLFRMLPKKYGVPALVLAVLIALSRLYVGVHYPTDVIAGIAIGIALAELAMLIVKRLRRARRA